ncbi:MAG TPA: hypothetical protein VGR33_06630 [Actinomycetota bacterium]|jgi:hypothetical protein|nr:hypothetical protein [Actinomycetota bacterium]
MIHALATAAKSKVAIAATAAALATGGGVAAKAAITGDANPFHWGHQVRQQVVSCQNNLGPDEHGIGQCVSDFAKQHGQQVREAHSQAGSHPQAGSHGPGEPTTGHTPAGTPASGPSGPAGS